MSDVVWKELTEWLEQKLDQITSQSWVKDGLVDDVVLRLVVAEASREIERPYAYARTILRNLVRDRIRSLERTHTALEAVARERAQRDSQHSGRGSVEDRELVEYLLERSSLSSLQERVIRMMYMEGKSVRDVASLLSRNPGTIKQHHDRAIRKLAEQAGRVRVAP